MASAVFHIECRVQNVETDEHIKAVGIALERAASSLSASCIMILGSSCNPKIEAYGEDFANGRYDIKLRSPDEVDADEDSAS